MSYQQMNVISESCGYPVSGLAAAALLHEVLDATTLLFAGAVLGLVIGELVSRYGPKLFQKRG